MKNANMWLTILASVGVGAAAYYSMSKSDQPMSKAMESVAPMLTNMTNSNSGGENNKIGDGSNSGILGPHGMS